jgi:hypothetical protein
MGFLLGLLLAGSIYFTRVNWALLQPKDAASAWLAIGAMAAVITAITSIAIAVFAFRGLRSLTIARDEIVHRATREAKLCAIQRLEEIAKEIIPLNTNVLEAMASGKVKAFLGPTDAIELEPDKADLTTAKAWYSLAPQEAYRRIITLLNRLEAWSVYFTEGVADPDTAFEPMAPLLRSWVGQYYAVLLVLRSGSSKSSGKFPNLVRLYLQWTAKMDKQQLDRLHRDIAGQLEQAEARLAQSKLAGIIPNIGP